MRARRSTDEPLSDKSVYPNNAKATPYGTVSPTREPKSQASPAAKTNRKTERLGDGEQQPCQQHRFQDRPTYLQPTSAAVYRACELPRTPLLNFGERLF